MGSVGAMSAVGARLRSWCWDYVAVLAWLLILLVVVGGPYLVGWIDLDPLVSKRVLGEVFIALITVVPFFVYLVWTEIGPAHATWGKRRSGLAVRALTGTPPQPRSVVSRNVVKVAPWQLGHMAATRFMAAEAVPAAAVVYYALSLALLCAVAGPPLLRRRGLHDVIAGTVVLPERSSR